jgi:hypothetical protein
MTALKNHVSKPWMNITEILYEEKNNLVRYANNTWQASTTWKTLAKTDAKSKRGLKC